ncbi:esterase [Deinococcus irradiatisoli]|uniref:Esterase n=1 Tax=Deinococcus irradiatisoli TaxID=2202254 RepID=A0A2Z3JJI0_9DEIO|nr:PaaI family thioesterase [Deinococcus irradiatisoli]AWN23490.1 esterase [Deinococcus irradiatisoli]
MTAPDSPLSAYDPALLDTLSPEELGRRLSDRPGTLGQRIGIRVIWASRERLVGTLPVEGNRQPAGRLHGGASIALAEELASIGSWLNIDTRTHTAVGVDISATHVRAGLSGVVTGEATLSYRGRSVMVWQIELKDERGKLTTLARCTCNVVKL